MLTSHQKNIISSFSNPVNKINEMIDRLFAQFQIGQTNKGDRFIPHTNLPFKMENEWKFDHPVYFSHYFKTQI